MRSQKVDLTYLKYSEHRDNKVNIKFQKCSEYKDNKVNIKVTQTRGAYKVVEIK